MPADTATTPTPDRDYTIIDVFDASRELVFQAWTEPAHLTHWFGPRGSTTPLATIFPDVRPGGAWRATMVAADGAQAPIHGVYREVARPERLVFTTGDPDNTRGEVASVVTVTLTDLGGATEMVFHQAGCNTDQTHADAAKAGWIEFFERLAKHPAHHRAQTQEERRRCARSSCRLTACRYGQVVRDLGAERCGAVEDHQAADPGPGSIRCRLLWRSRRRRSGRTRRPCRPAGCSKGWALFPLLAWQAAAHDRLPGQRPPDHLLNEFEVGQRERAARFVAPVQRLVVPIDVAFPRRGVEAVLLKQVSG
jgi:uncharacterized protein YndB with AHSA1/START domain